MPGSANTGGSGYVLPYRRTNKQGRNYTTNLSVMRTSLTATTYIPVCLVKCPSILPSLYKSPIVYLHKSRLQDISDTGINTGSSSLLYSLMEIPWKKAWGTLQSMLVCSFWGECRMLRSPITRKFLLFRLYKIEFGAILKWESRFQPASGFGMII